MTELISIKLQRVFKIKFFPCATLHCQELEIHTNNSNIFGRIDFLIRVEKQNKDFEKKNVFMRKLREQTEQRNTSEQRGFSFSY
jgi:hypothetical protein